MPHGIVEYARRLTGQPITLDMGQGRSLRFIEESTLKGCPGTDFAWSPDGGTLVTACPPEVWAQSLDGKKISKGPSSAQTWSLWHDLQALDHPFRVVYKGLPEASGLHRPTVVIWDVGAGTSSILPASAFDMFAVDQEHAQVAVSYSETWSHYLSVLPLEGGAIKKTLAIPTTLSSLRWLPGGQKLLVGDFDGVLGVVNITTGDVGKLATPYAAVFPEGGSQSGWVKGLVLSPDGKSVAIFGEEARGPETGANGRLDVKAWKKWEEALGTTVEIRSVDDGRLLDRMPGPEAGVVALAWDSRDRFIAVAGRDALMLWRRQNGALTHLYYSPGITHGLSISPEGTWLALTTTGGVQIFRIEEK